MTHGTADAPSTGDLARAITALAGVGHSHYQVLDDRVDPKVSALPGYVEFEFGGLYGHRLTVPQAVAELMLVHLRLLHQRPTEAGVA